MGSVVIAVVLVALLSILFYYAKTGVPPVPATADEIASVVELLREAGVPSNAKIYELGCGWGSLVLGLARAFRRRPSSASSCLRSLFWWRSSERAVVRAS